MQDDQDNGEFPISDNPESNQTSYDDEAAALKQKAEADIAQERKKAVNEVKDEIGGIAMDSSPITISSECLVVCFPRSIFLLILPVSIFTSDCRRLIRDDFPTPEGPAIEVVFPFKSDFNSLIFSSSFALVKITGYPHPV